MGNLKKKIVSCMLAVMCVMPWLEENVCESADSMSVTQECAYAKIDPVAMESLTAIIKAKNKEECLKALRSVEQKIELYPDNAIFYFLRAELYGRGRLNKRQERIENLDKAIMLNPNFARAYSLRADEYLLDKQDDEALTYYGKVIELEPNNVYPYRVCAGIYIKKKDDENALLNLNKVIANAPYCRTIERYHRAKIFFSQGKYDEAVQDCNRIISEDIELKGTDMNSNMLVVPETGGCYIPPQNELVYKAMSRRVKKAYTSSAHVLCGKAYYAQGKYQEAFVEGKTALESVKDAFYPENVEKEAKELINLAEKALGNK